MKWWDQMPWSSFSECWALSNFFTLLFQFHQEAFEFLFTFCHKDGVICIFEVIDISPGNLDSSLCFLQPSISHDVLFTLDDQNTGASASASVLSVNVQGWSPLRLTGLISLLSKGLSEVFSSTTVWRHQSLAFCLLYSPALKTIYVTTGKTIALSVWIFVRRVMSAFEHTV